MMALRERSAKASGTDLRREMLGFSAERSMGLKAGSSTAASFGGRHPGRLAPRNRLSWAGLRDVRREGRAAPPEAAATGGEGPDGGEASGLHPRRGDAIGRRAGQDAIRGLPALSLAGIGSKAAWPCIVVGMFPNGAATTRLVGAFRLEQNDAWDVQRARYMTLGSIARTRDHPAVGFAAVTG